MIAAVFDHPGFSIRRTCCFGCQFVPNCMAALSLTCKQCNAQLKSVKEAQDHGEVTGHSQFEESTEPVSIYTAIFEVLERAQPEPRRRCRC